MAEGFGAAAELGAEGLQVRAVAEQGGVGFCRPDGEREIRVERGGGAVAREGVAVAGVQIGFAREIFGEEHVVGGEFEVVVGDVFRFFAEDGGAVGEVPDGDQVALDVDGVVGGEQEVIARLIFGEGVGADADGPDGFRVRVAVAGDGAVAVPDDAGWGA